MPGERVQRRLAAVLAADVAGYSRLMGRDEERTLAQLKTLRKTLVDPAIATHRGRIVKTTGDGMLVEFASAVDAARCATELQREMADGNIGVPPELRIEFRIGIHVGDIIIDDDDIFGDGVNIAARLESIAEPGGVCISDDAYRQIRGKIDVAFENIGKQTLKNIAEPMDAWQIRPAGEAAAAGGSVAVCKNPGSEPARQTVDRRAAVRQHVGRAGPGLSRRRNRRGHYRGAFLYSLVFRHRPQFGVHLQGPRDKRARRGQELGVAYLLEGSVQKAGNRLRIIVQLIETEGGAHVWSSRFDGALDEFFDLEDRITEQVAGALQPSIRLAEIERSRRKRPQDLGSYDYTMRALPHVWALEKEESGKALELLEQALAIDPDYPLALSLAGWCHAQRSVYNWADDIAASQAMARSLAERAAEMSGDDSVILAVLGAVHTFVRNHGTARVLLERAVTLDPNAAWAWSRLGWLEAYSDQSEKAIVNFERALRLSPMDPMNFNNYVGIGSAHEVAEEYDEAAAYYRRALEERPNASWLYRNIASSLSGAGRVEEAKQAFAEMLRFYPDLTVSKYKQAMVCSPATLDRMGENLRKLGLPD